MESASLWLVRGFASIEKNLLVSKFMLSILFRLVLSNQRQGELRSRECPGAKYAQPFAFSERKGGLQNFILPEFRSANFRRPHFGLDFKMSSNCGKIPCRALCAGQHLSISLNVKLGGVFERSSNILSKTPNKEGSLLDKLATPQKNTLCSFHFARADFLLKEKKTFVRGSALNEQDGGSCPLFDFARAWRNSPPPSMLAPLWRRPNSFCFAKAPHERLCLPHPPVRTQQFSPFDLTLIMVL